MRAVCMDIFNGTFLDGEADWIVSFLQQQVYIGPMFLLMLEESGVPLPVPGDLILAYLGYEVSKGLISFYLAFILMMFSVLVGSSILYYLSYRFGQRFILKIGKYIHLDEKRLLLVENKFKKYGVWVVIFGRHIPGFRVPITVFAGMSDMKYTTFIISTFISTVFWVPFYLQLGMRLGPRTANLLHGNKHYLLLLIIPAVILVLTFLFLRNNRQNNRKE
jgi:membrane protein DedA with SNARE-associated domain